MKQIKSVIAIVFILALAACGGSNLSIDHSGGGQGSPLHLSFPPGQAVEHRLPLRISGGVRPYESRIEGCPDWVTLFPDQGVLAGIAPAGDHGRTFFCTFVVTEADPGFRPPRTVSYGLRLTIVSASSLQFREDGAPVDLVHLRMQERASLTFEAAIGGVGPYTYELLCTLPGGLRFSPETRILSGTPLEAYRGPDCTYRVTDSASPPARLSRSVTLIVDPLDPGAWRFRIRTVAGSDHALNRTEGTEQPFVILPHAIGGTGTPTYSLPDIQLPLTFAAGTRVLSYTHANPGPLLNSPMTFRYQVSDDDALCVDITYRPDPDADGLIVNVRIRDDAYWDGTEYRCPDAPPQSVSSSGATVSNPVHTALGPVHARRAVRVAHSAVQDRVRRWTPGAPRMLSAISPAVGLGSLSGRSEGFDYSGSSESLSAGAETGAGSWQAGLVASFTRTELHYRAEAALSEQGYRAGEHDTQILSLHPFAAWHAPSGGHLWASLGGGTGKLRHRDDLGFPAWSRSDVGLLAYAVGAAVPVADILSGELQAEAGIESFAFEIEGGGRISSSLPKMRGHDYGAGLAWSAPVPGAPSVSMAYKHLTGDGPEGGRLETKGSVSVAGVFDPRLSLTGSAEASFGLGDHEQDSWSLGGGVRFTPDVRRGGFGLDLDTRLASLTDGRSAGFGMRGEVGYGLWGGPFFGTVRPYAGLTAYPGGGSPGLVLGLDLRDTPNSRVKLEFHDRAGGRSRGVRFTLRHRF